MSNEVLKNPWVRAGLFTAAGVCVLLLAYALRPVLIPLFFAFLVAYVFDPVVDFFEGSGRWERTRRKVTRATAITGMAVLACILLVLTPVIVVPMVIHEAQALSTGFSQRPGQSAAPSEGGSANNGTVSEAENSRFFRGAVNTVCVWTVKVMGWSEGDLEAKEAREIVHAKAVILGARLGSMIEENLKGLGEAYGGSLSTAAQSTGRGIVSFFSATMDGVMGVVLFLANFSIFAFVAGYLLKDYDTVVAHAAELVPPRFQETSFRLLGDIDAQIRSFMRGQSLVCAGLGGMYAVGLLIAGTPLALVIALFGAFANLVPYLGIILTGGPALVLTMLKYGPLDWHVAMVVFTFIAAQFVEGSFLTPKIVGDQVGLNPVWVILAIMVFGSWMGFLGLLLAVPIAASLKVLVVEGVARYKASSVFDTVSEDGD